MCWRFGARDKEAGGLGSRAAFYGGYRRASGREIDPARVYYWEVFAHLRWAVIALQQGDRYLRGGERSLDLALTGRRPPEMEYELLRMTPPGLTCAAAVREGGGMTGDRPDGAALLETAARALREAVLPALPPEHRLTLLMALNAMGIAERELRDALGQAEAGEGADAARALADKIRAGAFDEGCRRRRRCMPRSPPTPARRLSIANPKYLRQAEGEG